MDSVVTVRNPNGSVQPLLTDLYQITMAYAYWKSGKMDDYAVFDLFFRKNPFFGEFTVFAGLQDCLAYLKSFHFSDSDINYLHHLLPSSVEEEFFEYLSSLTTNEIILYSVDEGSVVFPRVPIMRIEGPLIIAQLLETTLLTLVNYASLVATNASRYRIAAGKKLQLLEFGLRRAQGPDGGLSASKYVYMGGFDGTSNVLAGKLFDIPVKGTHAHAYVSSYSSLKEITHREMVHKTNGTSSDFVELCLSWRKKLSKLFKVHEAEASEGELSAFMSYAMAFPDNFLALIDTYDVLRSGLLNFCSVAAALFELGYQPQGIRIDSGDLAYWSIVARDAFQQISEKLGISGFKDLTIVASNDINEETIISLNEQGHEINCFGVGTHLVTCQRQPALGCVYKLVEINKEPKIKLSQDVVKMTIPGRKNSYRLYGADGKALCDLMTLPDEPPPVVDEKVLCRHPFEESKRAWVKPTRVENIYKVYWSNGSVTQKKCTLEEIRDNVCKSLKSLRPDHRRSLNPTPYKVSVSDKLYHFIHRLWLENAPIGELS